MRRCRRRGLRLPGPIGQAASILGGLVVGSAAVEASIVSPVVLIVVAIAGIAGYTVPSQEFSAALRIWRFGLAIAASIGGLFAVTALAAVLVYRLAQLESFGVPYLTPLRRLRQRAGEGPRRHPLAHPPGEVPGECLKDPKPKEAGMKRVLALVFLFAPASDRLCRHPQSRESGATAVVSVLGVEPAGQGIHLWRLRRAGGEEEPFRCDSQGETPAAAVEGLTNRGEQVVSCAHVEHLLLTQNAAGTLPELLSYAFQEPQQSTETQLWVVRADTLEEAFSGEADTAKRMSVIKSQGKKPPGVLPSDPPRGGGGLGPEGAPLLLPALEVGEQGLAFAGFALYQEGGITQWLTGPEALGAALLLGDRVHWTGSVEAQAMVLQSTGCRVVPQMEEGRLTGLSIRCRLEGFSPVVGRAARGCGQTGGRDRPGHVPGGGGAPAGRGRRDGSAGPGGAVESVPVAGAVQPVAYGVFYPAGGGLCHHHCDRATVVTIEEGAACRPAPLGEAPS